MTKGIVEKMPSVNTRLLVADYLKFRLEKDGLGTKWPSCPTLGEPGKVQLSMRTLGKEFEHRYNDVFSHMCNQLYITPNNAQATFVTIVNELFSGGVKWGRIVALFSFGGCLAVQCIEKEMPLLVDQILDWVTNYVESHLHPWIMQHNGWDGFVQFFESSPEKRQESPWNSLSQIAGLALGGIGAVALGAFLINRS